VQIIGVCETKSHECSCRIDDSAWYLAGTLSLVRRLGVHDSLLPYSTQQRSVHAETGIVNGPGPLAREEVLVVFVSSPMWGSYLSPLSLAFLHTSDH
jgi:hypothetical protein